MSDLTNAIQHGRTRRPGAIDAALIPGTSSLITGLLGYWKLDETSGTRADSLALNNATVNGSVSSATGKISNAVSIATGAANGLVVAGGLSVNGQSRSVSLWCYPTDVSTQFGIASGAAAVASGTPLWLMVLRQGGGSGPFAIYHGAGYRNGTTVAAANTWYHIVYTWNSTTQAVGLWVNGSQEVSIIANDSGGGTNFYMGASFGGYGGLIDEVGIWNRVVSSTEIAALYKSGNGSTYPYFA